MQLKATLKNWQLEAEVVQRSQSAMNDNHIPGILMEEDELRAECAAFGWDKIGQLGIIMKEHYTYADPCVEAQKSKLDKGGSSEDKVWKMSDFAM